MTIAHKYSDRLSLRLI